MKLRSFVLLFPLLVLGLPSPARAQAVQAETPTYEGAPVEHHPFDETTWRELTDGIDYSNDRPQSRKKNEGAEETGAPPYRNNGGAFNPATGNLIMKIFVVTVGLILLILLIRSLLTLKRRPRDKRFDPNELNIDIEQIEENIHDSDLEGYIRRALEGGNFALAVRLYYLAALKALSIGKSIHWKKDKTNRDYRREMQGHPLAGEFQRLTQIFEQTWYGQWDLTEDKYREMEPAFRSFLKKTDQHIHSQAGAATAADTP